MNTVVRPVVRPRTNRHIVARRRLGRFGAAVGLAGLVLAISPPATTLAEAGAAPSSTSIGWCGISWGSLPKSAAPSATGHAGSVIGARAGRHACYDRLVIDVRGPIAGYDVRYVDAVHAEGSGKAVPVLGGARLQVTVGAPADRATRPLDVAGWSTFRQVAWAGSFEGSTTLGLGVRARLPMRVFVLPGAEVTRLVIDVAHRW